LNGLNEKLLLKKLAWRRTLVKCTPRRPLETEALREEFLEFFSTEEIKPHLHNSFLDIFIEYCKLRFQAETILKKPLKDLIPQLKIKSADLSAELNTKLSGIIQKDIDECPVVYPSHPEYGKLLPELYKS
jgi:hypothetical protein